MTVERFVARVVATFPHDRGAFTQGLLISHGRLYEGTGQVGESWLREVELSTGAVLRQRALARPHFGEGIAVVGDEVFQLTWQSGAAFAFDLETFMPTRELAYPGEGWGLAPWEDGLVMSDGSSWLRFVDPRVFAERRRVQVTLDGRPLTELNALCTIGGEVLANLWHRDTIVRIDPVSGRVTGLIELSAVARDCARDGVANGIAWDAASQRLFVTGKHWPSLFEITLEQAG